ncbi:unnamed protein product [Schistosoma mattheei]|uniref:Uncharacterized protein n=1 Tax=Schistosoma mattheei TaxID=31246 RepID=A0A183P7X3_9TREM|nr:unnamed protein product [Schistosoma mattheei]
MWSYSFITKPHVLTDASNSSNQFDNIKIGNNLQRNMCMRLLRVDLEHTGSVSLYQLITFGSVGSGPNVVFNNPSVHTNTSIKGSQPQATVGSHLHTKEHSAQMNVDLPPGVVLTNLSGRQCVAKFDFNAEFQEEMSFRQGDRLRLLGEEDENWWFAELITHSSSGQPTSQGLIPANYVKLLSNNTSNSTVSNMRSNPSKVLQPSAQIARAT